MLLRASLPKTGNDNQTSRRQAFETYRSDLFHFTTKHKIVNSKRPEIGQHTLLSYSVGSEEFTARTLCSTLEYTIKFISYK